LNLLQDVVDAQFGGQAFWVKCEVTDVKKYDQKNWCFCKFLEKKAGQIVAESQAVFWQQGYQHLRRFEQATGRKFENGIEISALVLVKFTPKYGFKLEVQELDISFALGQMELARQHTMNKLISLFPGQITQEEDRFLSPNNQLALPRIIQRVALVTANHSDGQRDFLQELSQNRLGYQFRVTGFYTTIQGETAPALLVNQLEKIAQKSHLFDVVAMVRGGGSQTDLKPFDDYELAKTIAFFPLPILTGIGHDRNTSIADLMARQFKVPTKVAAAIVEHNHLVEMDLLEWNEILENKVARMVQKKRNQLDTWGQQMQWVLPNRIAMRKQKLEQFKGQLLKGAEKMVVKKQERQAQLHIRMFLAARQFVKLKHEHLKAHERLVEQLSPHAVLKRGFAIAEQHGKIITNLEEVRKDAPLITRLQHGAIESEILNIAPYEMPTN
jgi:exodeoxyribonuclease VII large subunit